ncbi:hypothetical protein VNO77_23035 [Canavalia gladiata]|uniref:Uncharacterized protein n=1 Tax=Canavalia gladiata TaxID=3824 RepID=A0AAN9L3R4_CANGL
MLMELSSYPACRLHGSFSATLIASWPLSRHRPYSIARPYHGPLANAHLVASCMSHNLKYEHVLHLLRWIARASCCRRIQLLKRSAAAWLFRTSLPPCPVIMEPGAYIPMDVESIEAKILRYSLRDQEPD